MATQNPCAELVLANHILYAKAIVDGFGHVSLRHPDKPDHFLISRSIAPSRVTLTDIQTIALDGTVLDDTRPPYLERFIHGAIYRERPDVMAVVHSHTHSVIPFGICPAVPLRPVFHMAGFLGTDTPVFEIRDHLGADSDLLIRDPATGRALAQQLAAGSTILMRGHGMTVVGTSLRQAVFRAIYTDINAQLQLSALPLGQPYYLTAAEAANAAFVNDNNMNRAWDLWAQEVSAAAPI